MENKDIIEADYKELTLSDDPQEIAAEIRLLASQMYQTTKRYCIEIGKRFTKAKSLVEYGKWGEYCEKYTGCKQRTAEEFMKIYKEYGETDQQSLFGNVEESRTFANLEKTQLLLLAAIPADEREQFVEKNNIDENTTVKELRELIEKQKQQLWDKDIEHNTDKNNLTKEIKAQKQQIEEANSEIERLTAELEAMEERPPVDAPNSDVAALIAEAEENVRASAQKTIDDLRADVEKKQKEIDKKQKQLDKLKNNDLAAENSKLKESVSEAEKKNADLEAEIERLKKEARLGSDKKLVALDLCFKTVQDDITRLTDALKECRESENYEKLRTAIVSTIDGLVNTMKVGE